ncbi:MAG: hypothetical protein ABIO70_01105 [Pseudomonadota bacterium]
MRTRRLLPAFLVLALGGLPLISGADVSSWSIDPESLTLTLGEGETFSEDVTLHMEAGAVTPMADVYILADTTGSMGGSIGNVRTNAVTLVNNLITGMPGVDLRIGVGNYKDFPYDSYAFRHQVDPTTNQTTVVSAINSWYASGGADAPEGEFYAFDRLAHDVDPAGGDIGWRAGAEKILVWFGDWSAHDPVCAYYTGLGYDITEATVTADLQAAGIAVLGISVSSGYGLDMNPYPYSYDYSHCTRGGSAGQATRITAATGGSYTTGINPSTLAAQIQAMVETAVTTIDEIDMAAAGDIAPYVTGITPAGGYGPVDTSAPADFVFTVDYEGACNEGGDLTLTGTIDATADGAIVGQEAVSLTLPSCNLPPVAECTDVTVEADEYCMGCASVDGGTWDPDGDVLTIVEDPGCDYALGDTEVTLTATDPSGETDSCTGTVTVIDTTAPEVTITAAPEMWPPNHNYWSFTLSDCAAVSWDNCDEAGLDVDADGVITAIWSDEVEDARGGGDGNTNADIVITGDATFDLRAERQGSLDGRVYGIEFSVTDSAGNATEATCYVSVPHDQSGAPAVNSGAAAGYTVTP